jgi:hypothetical protein
MLSMNFILIKQCSHCLIILFPSCCACEKLRGSEKYKVISIQISINVTLGGPSTRLSVVNTPTAEWYFTELWSLLHIQMAAHNATVGNAKLACEAACWNVLLKRCWGKFCNFKNALLGHCVMSRQILLKTLALLWFLLSFFYIFV